MSVQGPSIRPFPATPPAAPARPQSSRAGSAPATSTSAPASAHSLWDLLTDDERAFFAQQASLGTLQYGRGSRAAAKPANDAPIGGRIDVRG